MKILTDWSFEAIMIGNRKADKTSGVPTPLIRFEISTPLPTRLLSQFTVYPA